MFTIKTLKTGTLFLSVLWLAACGGGGGGGGGGGAPAPAGVLNLAQTGQATCYDTSVPPLAVACTTAGIPAGQDGATRTGVAAPTPRFSVDGTNSCQVDNLTGLMWTRNANLPPGTRTWQQALDYANTLSLCGFADWRLPNAKELRTLVNYSAADNATALVAMGFNNVQGAYYWSSTSQAGSPASAWAVSMGAGAGAAFAFGKASSAYFVWPVRAGQ